MSNIEKIHMTVKEIKYASLNLCAKIEALHYKPDIILTIAKGGLILSYYMAKHFGIKDIIVLNISSYEEQKQQEIKDETKCKELIQQIIKDKKIVLVDDLVDSGKTMQYVIENYLNNVKEYKTSVLYYKDNTSIVKPDYYYKKVGKEWIEFEYEL